MHCLKKDSDVCLIIFNGEFFIDYNTSQIKFYVMFSVFVYINYYYDYKITISSVIQCE
jgi:hypothetical protein